MADEETPIEGEEELAPIEEVQEEEASQVPTVEDFARAQGWKSAEEWDGEGEHRSAEEFLRFGLDRTRDLSKELKDIRRETSQVAQTTARIVAESTERARAEERARLERIHAQAVEEGDVATAREAADGIARTSQPAPTADPQVAQFIQDNPWFNSDPVAQAVATAEAGRLAAAGASVAEQLSAAQVAVHKRFPEHAPAKPPAKAVEVAKPATARSAKKGKTFADLPAQAQEVARALVSKGLLKDTAAYVRQYYNTEGTVE